MIYVNIFNITPDQNNIQVSIETTVGSNITSLKLWSHDTYKSIDKFINLNYKLKQVNNKEVFLINVDELSGIDIFSGIYFLEITSNAPVTECTSCSSTMLAVTANLNFIKEFILNKVLELSICDGSIFSDSICNGNTGMDIVNINILLDSLLVALSFGYYEEALEIYNSLLKLYNITPGKDCTNCDKLKNPGMNIGLGYGTLGNTLILT